MEAAVIDAEAEEGFRISQGRGPAYPFIPLDRVIERAEQLRDKGAQRAPIPPETAYRIWGFAAQSSGARQTLAAMNYFGLMEYTGRGTDRRVKLTDLAHRIVLDRMPGSESRRAAIREAALSPAIHQELYGKFGVPLPDDIVLQTYLERDRGFNTQGSASLTKEYRKTIEFADLVRPTTEVISELHSAVEVGAGVTPVASTSRQQVATAVEATQSDVRQSDSQVATLPLDEGYARLEWPKRLSSHSFDDLCDWLELMKRKAARSVEPT